MGDAFTRKTDEQVVTTEGLLGPADVVVLCEHASHHFPARFGDLGLSVAARISHAAWDPGALELARSLAEHLRAPLVSSNVSRLLYDCNRPPDSASAMAVQSEQFTIPGNQALDARARAVRIDQIYHPFVAEVGRVQDTAQPRALITMHTFTPIYNGRNRSVEIGILHDEDARLADAVLAIAAPEFLVERNAPYGPEDGVTHSLKLHAMSRGLLNVMIEVRNDLVADTDGLARVSAYLNPLLAAALRHTSGAA